MPTISAGERLNFADVNWKENEKSLVFFLNKDCRFGDASGKEKQMREEFLTVTEKPVD